MLCKRCQQNETILNNKLCTECKSIASSKKDLKKRQEYDRHYYQKNKDKKKNQAKQYQETHKEQCKKRKKAHYQKNKEDIKAKRLERHYAEHEKSLKQNRESYYRNKHKYKENMKIYAQKHKKEIAAYHRQYNLKDDRIWLIMQIKRGACCDCCGFEDYRALVFHHVDPSAKNFGVNIRANKKTWHEILKELSKCVILCSNCHRILHDETHKTM